MPNNFDMPQGLRSAKRIKKELSSLFLFVTCVGRCPLASSNAMSSTLAIAGKRRETSKALAIKKKNVSPNVSKCHMPRIQINNPSHQKVFNVYLQEMLLLVYDMFDKFKRGKRKCAVC